MIYLLTPDKTDLSFKNANKMHTTCLFGVTKYLFNLSDTDETNP